MIIEMPDYVPPGWRSQAGLYKQVVRPYCAMCHLAGPIVLWRRAG